MKNDPEMILRLLEGRWGAATCEFTQIHFASFPARDFWQPAINAFRCEYGYFICADLAGVNRSEIEVTVEPRRLCIRGRRRLPEPEKTAGALLHVLAMEIDYGRFAREVVFPNEINPKKASSFQHNGLLWIRLPLRRSRKSL